MTTKGATPTPRQQYTDLRGPDNTKVGEFDFGRRLLRIKKNGRFYIFDLAEPPKKQAAVDRTSVRPL